MSGVGLLRMYDGAGLCGITGTYLYILYTRHIPAYVLACKSMDVVVQTSEHAYMELWYPCSKPPPPPPPPGGLHGIGREKQSQSRFAHSLRFEISYVDCHYPDHCMMGTTTHQPHFAHCSKGVTAPLQENIWSAYHVCLPKCQPCEIPPATWGTLLHGQTTRCLLTHSIAS